MNGFTKNYPKLKNKFCVALTDKQTKLITDTAHAVNSWICYGSEIETARQLEKRKIVKVLGVFADGTLDIELTEKGLMVA